MGFEDACFVWEDKVLDKRLEVGVATVKMSFAGGQMGRYKCDLAFDVVLYDQNGTTSQALLPLTNVSLAAAAPLFDRSPNNPQPAWAVSTFFRLSPNLLHTARAVCPIRTVSMYLYSSPYRFLAMRGMSSNPFKYIDSIAGRLRNAIRVGASS